MTLQLPPQPGPYRAVADGARGGQLAAVAASTTLVMTPNTIVSRTAATAGLGPFDFDPALWGIDPATLILCVRAILFTNDVAPGVNIGCSLYPVNSSTGAAANNSINVGAQIGASIITYATPAANVPGLRATSGDFAAPVGVGSYVFLASVATGGMAASSSAVLRASLIFRRVGIPA